MKAWWKTQNDNNNNNYTNNLYYSKKMYTEVFLMLCYKINRIGISIWATAHLPLPWPNNSQLTTSEG